MDGQFNTVHDADNISPSPIEIQVTSIAATIQLLPVTDILSDHVIENCYKQNSHLVVFNALTFKQKESKYFSRFSWLREDVFELCFTYYQGESIRFERVSPHLNSSLYKSPQKLNGEF